MSVKKNFLYNFILTGSNVFFPLLTFPYLTRVFGADGIGISNFILSFGQNFIIISALGLPVYGIREIARTGDDIEKRSKLFIELLVIHIVFTCFLLVIYFLCAYFLTDLKDFKQLTLMGGVIILLNVLTIEWLFSGLNDFRYITFRSIIIRSLSVVSIFVFIKDRSDINIYFVIMVLTLLITALINLNYARRYLLVNFNLSQLNFFIHVKSVFVLGIYMVMTSVYSVLPTTLLGFFSTKAAVGYFYSADRIIRMVISVFTALTTVMVPKLNLLIEKGKMIEYKATIQRMLVLVISVGMPISVLIFSLASPLIYLLTGGDFEYSIVCVKLMSPIIILVAFAQVFILMILSVNRKDKKMLVLSSIGVVISLFINVLFIPIFAEKATAFSQLIAEFSVTFFSFFIAKKLIEFRFPLKLFLFNILFMIPVFFISMFWINMVERPVFQLIFTAISFGLYFFMYQYLFFKEYIMNDFILPILNGINLKIRSYIK